MLFANYFKGMLIGCLIMFVMPVYAVLVAEKRCGDYLYQVELTEFSKMDGRTYAIYYKKRHQKRQLISDISYIADLDAACVQDKNGRYLFYYAYSTGGNCDSCQYYGLYDPEKDKILVTPGVEELKKEYIGKFHAIMGYYPPDMTKDDRMFCCSDEQQAIMKSFKEDIFRTEQQCGSYTFKVQTSDLQDAYRKDYRVYYKKAGEKWRLFLSTIESFDFKAACLQDSKNHFVFYWEDYFGRNYNESSPYGLFDIGKGKIVLEPSHLTVEQYHKIASMLKVDSINKLFCCSREQEEAAANKDPRIVDKSN